jgi:hypothetical protein
MTAVHHRYATVRGRRLFYREAGPAEPLYPKLHAWLRERRVPSRTMFAASSEGP